MTETEYVDIDLDFFKQEGICQAQVGFAMPVGQRQPAPPLDLESLRTQFMASIADLTGSGLLAVTPLYAPAVSKLREVGIPAVIARQFVTSDGAGTQFLPSLYAALATGQPIADAEAQYRVALALDPEYARAQAGLGSGELTSVRRHRSCASHQGPALGGQRDPR